MKYLKKTQLRDGTTVHRFVPPDDVRKAGVVKSQTFMDGRSARYEVPRLLEKVEAYRKGDIKAGNVGPASKMLSTTTCCPNSLPHWLVPLKKSMGVS